MPQCGIAWKDDWELFVFGIVLQMFCWCCSILVRWLRMSMLSALYFSAVHFTCEDLGRVRMMFGYVGFLLLHRLPSSATQRLSNLYNPDKFVTQYGVVWECGRIILHSLWVFILIATWIILYGSVFYFCCSYPVEYFRCDLCNISRYPCWRSMWSCVAVLWVWCCG